MTRSTLRLSTIVAALALAVVALVVTRGLVHAHARLVSSDPAAGSVILRVPQRLRLVFSERVDASVSSVSIVGPDSSPRPLAASADTADAKALTASLGVLGPAQYRVEYRTVSADGHRITGSVAFTVMADTTTRPPPPTPSGATDDQPETSGFTAAGLVRGLALGLLIGYAGLLFFAPLPSSSGMVAKTGLAALVLLVAHVLAWTMTTEPRYELRASWVATMLSTTAGRVELARFAAALLSVLLVLVTRRRGVALAFAVLALALGGALGHPAAITSAVTIPAKAIHLCAAAAWLGGLIWLVVTDHRDLEGFAREARRVSSVAIWAVGLVALSGLLQARFFVAAPADLVATRYGVLVLVKIAGLLVLLSFGAFHRYRALPGLGDAGGAARLRRSVRQEIVVFALVTLVGGVLSYVSPRLAEPPAIAANQGR